jgi:hypothetical protein
VMLPPQWVRSQTRPAAGDADPSRVPQGLPAAPQTRTAGTLRGLLCAALLLLAVLPGACVTEQPGDAAARRVWVLHVTVEPGVYRITVRWSGAAPAYREALLLERAARLAAAADAPAFAVLNSSEPLGHAEWLAPQAVFLPIPLVPAHDVPDGKGLTALIRVFPGTSPPDALRLYDAQRILRERISVIR